MPKMSQTDLLKKLVKVFGYYNRGSIYDMCLIAERDGIVTPINTKPSRYQWSRRMASLKCRGEIRA